MFVVLPWIYRVKGSWCVVLQCLQQYFRLIYLGNEAGACWALPPTNGTVRKTIFMLYQRQGFPLLYHFLSDGLSVQLMGVTVQPGISSAVPFPFCWLGRTALRCYSTARDFLSCTISFLMVCQYSFKVFQYSQGFPLLYHFLSFGLSVQL